MSAPHSRHRVLGHGSPSTVSLASCGLRVLLFGSLPRQMKHCLHQWEVLTRVFDLRGLHVLRAVEVDTVRLENTMWPIVSNPRT
jgi:hypothetical protein